MLRLTLLLAVLSAPAALADVRQIDAGPIWNNWDAEDKCPEVCQREDRVWTGDWRTTPGAMTSSCDCRGGRHSKSDALPSLLPLPASFCPGPRALPVCADPAG